jgi:hypothetical protein
VPVFRVAYRGGDPFGPPPWHLARPDGTFHGRFDDPTKADGRVESNRFRVVYCASDRAGAFGETIARFRVALGLLAGRVVDEAGLTTAVVPSWRLDPEDPRHAVVPATWRADRLLAQTVLHRSLRFVDIAAGETIQHLRHVLAAVATALELPDFDLSSVTGPQRRLTQACARYVYDQTDEAGEPVYAGIRYVSRLNPAWTCWAIFHDRLQPTPAFPGTIFPDDPSLMEAARLLGLTIKSFEGTYVRPWREQ